MSLARAVRADPPRIDQADAARARARALIEAGDCFRRSPSRFSQAVAYKEWQHFLLHAPATKSSPPLKLIINFNLIDDVWAASEEPNEVARLIVLAKLDEWTGITERIDQRDVDVCAGRIDARFGSSSLHWTGREYQVRVDLPQHSVQIALDFEPQTVPGLAINQPLAPNLKLSWLFVPRLLASGTVSVDGEHIDVDRAMAYHDHNWSVFRWGDDFTWEWASVLPDGNDCPWTIVLMRLTNRARTVIRSQAVFVWHRAEKARTFRDRELTVHTEGLLRVNEPFQTPPVMRLLTTGATVDVPQHFKLEAGTPEQDHDWLVLHFEPKALSQVVMPSETELEGVTVLNEATGPVSVCGQVASRSIDFEGNGVFEFLRS